MPTRTDRGLAKVAVLQTFFVYYITQSVKPFLDKINKSVDFQTCNASLHLVDLREQKILIEIEVHKSFVMKYIYVIMTGFS